MTRKSEFELIEHRNLIHVLTQ